MLLVPTLLISTVVHIGTSVDFEDEANLTFAGLIIEKMEHFMGRMQPQCFEYKLRCHKFMKCFGNCDSQLIPASHLNHATASLTEEQKERANHVKTNPCVGMFAFCLSVDYFRLERILELTSPDLF